MTKQQFEIIAEENVQKIINYISQEDYDKLSLVTSIDSSWCNNGETQAEGIKTFGKWLKEQLQMWSEDYGKEFVVDPFDKKNLNLDDLEDNRSFSEYLPTSHGEKLDFWFEIKFTADDSEKLLSEFNVNF